MSDARVTTWIAPEVTGPVVNRRSRHSRAELDSIGQAAWEDGFQRGLEAGSAAAREQQKPELQALQQRIARLQAILDFMAKPLAELDETVEHELAGLACAIAQRVVRRELRTDPAQVIAAVREAVGLLPVSARDVRVYLHPEDAAILREKIAEPQSQRAWTIYEDPVLERGGCRIAAENSQVDARVDARIGAVIAAVIGDQRLASGRSPSGEAA
jgi:flagellar assembly protein FliH